MPVEFSPEVPTENSPVRCGSITAISARWDDFGEWFEVEFSDGLQRISGGTVAEAVGQGIVPGGILGLQGEQLGDGVAPALRSGAMVGRQTVADRGWCLPGLAAGTIAGLSLGVAEGLLALRLAAFWHLLFSVT